MTARILYIEDDPGLVRLVARTLRDRDCTVEHAGDGAEGLACLDAGAFDAVILDHHLPGGTGLDILEQLRERPGTPPVIYVTGADDLRIAVAALKAGASDYVLKDVAGHFRELLAGAIDEAVQRRRQEQERAQEERLRGALLRLSDHLRTLADPKLMVAAAAEILGLALDARRIAYGPVDPDRGIVVIECAWQASDLEAGAPVRALAEWGSALERLENNQAIVTDGLPAAGHPVPGETARIDLPVLEEGRLAAVFLVEAAAPRIWAPAEVNFVRDVADRTRAATGRRRAEMALAELAVSLERQVEARTRERNRLWETTNDLMGTIGLDGYVKNVNPAWTQMLGWSEAELLARPFLDRVDPADRPATAAALQQIAAGRTVTDFVHHLLRKDGGVRIVTWTAVPDAEGGVYYAVGRDLTEQRRAEEQLRHAQKMEAVGQLTGGLAHDFNNMLAGIAGSLEMMQARLAQGRPNDLERYLGAAQGAARRAAALTHRLLAFSRRQTLEPKPTDVNALVAGMEDLIQRTVGPAIGIGITTSPELWPTLVDPSQLENALLNLCINARDAMPDGGRITIESINKWLDAHGAGSRALRPGPYVLLRVADTGTGMTPEVVAKAFDPFFTTKPIGEGTGLGLSMIYGFAQQSGGHVRIESAPGCGTTIHLYLPRYEGALSREASAHALPPQRVEAGETILVVDDEPTVRMLVTEVLEDLGYVAIEAADGASGLKVLQSDVRLDLLVTDVGLPGGMNGRQMADAGRLARPDLKVLFITGYAENAVLNPAHLAPGMQVLVKPFTLDTLSARIQALIGTDS